MGNTKTLVKTLSTGIPDLADMVDNEIIWVTDSEILYKRIDASTLISNNPLTDASVAATPSVTANTAKESPSKTNVEAVLTGSIETHNHYGSYTVASLPAGTTGKTALVTDALSPTYLSTVVGGGSVVCPVIYNGTNWICH